MTEQKYREATKLFFSIESLKEKTEKICETLKLIKNENGYTESISVKGFFNDSKTITINSTEAGEETKQVIIYLLEEHLKKLQTELEEKQKQFKEL